MAGTLETPQGSSFSIVVIKRLIDVLCESGSIKKTNLAGKTGLNYPNCVRYVDLLRLLGWIEVSSATNEVSVTGLGRHVGSLLMMPFNTSAGASVPDLKLSSPDMTIEGNNNAVHKIMLVEDEPDLLLTYKLLLANEGYQVDSFEDGRSAIEKFKQVGTSYYDLVITDIRMKNINGLQLYHGIKAVDPGVMFIFVSALDAAQELLSVLPDITNRDIMKKPVEQKVFVKCVYQALQDSKRRMNVAPKVK
jgi:CheY-like chemotaxis protein